MKNRITGFGRKFTSVAVLLCLLFSIMAPTVLAVEDAIPQNVENVDVDPGSKGDLNYVSIGDSMANGYGFEGYYQNDDSGTYYDILQGKGVYGTGAYPLQFEKHLTAQGYNVKHTKLATSAMLPEDFYYILGGMEEAVNDGWGGWLDYIGTYEQTAKGIEDVKAYMQKAVKEADVITLGLGNASFGAFLLHKMTDALGIFGASFDDYQLNLDLALQLLDEEDRAAVVAFVDAYLAEIDLSMASQMLGEEAFPNVLNVLEYTVGSFIVYYKLCVEKILEMNPDVEIIFVGLLNTTYGMEIAMDENPENNFPVGDMMDGFFGVLNDYVKMIPTLVKAERKYPEASFKFAEQPEPKFICQVFGELKTNGWQNIQDGRLSGFTVRCRNIDAYNGSLRELISMAFSSMLGGQTLPEITIQMVECMDGKEDYSWCMSVGIDDPVNDPRMKLYIPSIMIYLGFEDAIAECADEEVLTLSGLLTIATDMMSAFANFAPVMNDLRTSLGDYLCGGATYTQDGEANPDIRGMVKIYALFKVGNGMSVHPTPEGHDEIIKAVIAAYEGEALGYDSKVVAL